MLARLTIFFVFVAAMTSPIAAAEESQGTKKDPTAEDSRRQEPSKSKGRPKPSLAEITRVTSAEAAGTAARDGKKKEEGSTAEASESDVTEFRPASPDEEPATGSSASTSKDKSKSVHGTVHGSSDAQGAGRSRAGGAVGASSKSGRRHIYVEADQTRTKRPSP